MQPVVPVNETRGEAAEARVSLACVKGGEDTRAAALLPTVYNELRRLAALYLRRERSDHTLQPTALVHEAFLRLFRQHTDGWRNRREFVRIAAQAMRRVLVDHARLRQSVKRGGPGAQRQPLDEAVAAFEASAGDLVGLDECLELLADVDPRKCQVVELRFFAGLSVEETADALGVSVRAVERDWTLAKAWLRAQLLRDL